MRQTVIALAVLILLVAAALRTVGLSQYPPGPHYDEAANIIITRTVAYGGARPFPMVENFQGREVLYYYLSAPFLMTIHNSRFALQLVGVFCNMLLVASTIALGRVMFGGRRGMLIGLAAGVAVAISIPQILLARQTFRAITLPTMQALSLLFLWHGLTTSRRRGWAWLAVGGIFGGLALYTYNSSRLFPVWMAIGGLALLIFSGRRRVHILKQGLMFFLPLILIGLPFGIYALQKPDIFLGRLYEVTGGEDAITLTESIARHARMFFIQGETLLRYNPRGRPYFTWPEGALLLAGLGAAMMGLRRGSAPRRAASLMLLLSPLMIVPSVIATSGFPPNHMRSIAMVPLIFIAVGLGFERLMAWQHRTHITLLILAALLLAGGINAGWTYAQWVTRADLFYETDADLAAAARWMIANIDHDEAVYIAAQDRYHPTIQVFDTPRVRWLGTDTLFLPPDGERIAVFPRSAPPDIWRDWLTEQGALITEGIPIGPDGRAVFEAARLSADMPLPLDTAPPGTSNANLRLIGEFHALALPNGRVNVITAWTVDSPPTAPDLTPIVQMEDALGNVIARADVFSVGTDLWEAGETLLQIVPGLRVPVGTPPGIYTLHMTWVARAVGDYLPYQDESGAFRGIWAEVGTLEVLRPNGFPPADDLPVDVRVDTDLASGVRLLGWDTLPQSTRPGETLPFTLYWQGTETELREDITYTLWLATPTGEVPLEASPSTLIQNPTGEWLTGQLMTDRIAITLPRDLPAGDVTLMLHASNGEQVDMGTLTISGLPRVFDLPKTDHIVEAALGEQLQLYGYTITEGGEDITIELVWYAIEEVEENYSVFVHFVGENGLPFDQRDATPQNNTYPTSLWAAGEYISDVYTLAQPTQPYSIRVGLYRPDDGTRLVAQDGTDFIEINNRK